MSWFRTLILGGIALTFVHCAPTMMPNMRSYKPVERSYKEAEVRQLVDCPTAYIAPKRSIEMSLRSFTNGGTLGGMTIGIWEDLMISGGFGGENLLGEGPIEWNPSPGVGVRWQGMFENYSYPAVSIGFDSQGYGAWADSTKRYRIKSKGFYLVASKNYFLSPTQRFGLGLHAGVNYSLEHADDDDDVNAFIGISWTNNSQPDRQNFGFHIEYDFGINDNGSRSLGAGKGYLNAGIKIAPAKELFSNRLYLEFDVRDILKNSKLPPDAPEGTELYSNRILKLVFMGYF